MKTPKITDLNSVVETSLKSDPLTKKQTIDEEKKKQHINKSITLTRYHIDFLIKKTSDEMIRIGKPVSVSRIIRDIIDTYIEGTK